MTASLRNVGPDLRALKRDNIWLGEHLAFVWDRYFPDTPCANPVDIAFAKNWKARLGLITYCSDKNTSNIRLNSLLRHPEVPECITTVTIAHEMVHYSHGFGSSLPRCYDHPHRGNVVEKELLARGLGQEYEEYLDWIDGHWDQFYHTQTVPPRHLWLARKSGAPARVVSDALLRYEQAASVVHVRPAVVTKS